MTRAIRPKGHWAAAAFIFLGASLAGPNAAAQQPAPCGPHETFAATLGGDYGERPLGSGAAAGGVTLELWTAPRTGTWSLLAVLPDGQACLVANGIGWQAPKPVGEAT